MDGMSLIPSESASFPDLVGQRHGYLPPNARRPSSRRNQKEAAVTSISAGPEENRPVRESQNELGRPSVSNEPAGSVAAPKNSPPETSRLLRPALPIPPQRSVAQMRAKIQAPEVASPPPGTRPRTPVRGLAIAHPPPIVAEKPANPLSSRFPLLNLPRRCVVRLVRFIACEVMAVGVLILGMALGFSHRTTDDPLSLFLKILAVVAAIAAVIVPVLFFGLPEEFPRSER